MASTYRRYCCVLRCSNTSHNRPDLEYFELPTEEPSLTKWLLLIGRDDLIKKVQNFKRYICEEHFSPHCLKKTDSGKYLKVHALPSLYLPQRQESNETNVSTVHPNTLTQGKAVKTSTQTIQGNKDYLGKRSLKNEPSSKQIIYRTSELQFLSNIFTKNELTELIRTDEKLINSKSKVTRYDNYRQYCLNLYYGSPQDYRLLKSAMHLPNLTTLYKYIPISTDINNRLMNALQKKVDEMSLKESQCIAVIDSMPLTPNLNYSQKTDKIIGFQEIHGLQMPLVAERGLIIMIRGMFAEWQQPVGYALLSHDNTNTNLVHWTNRLITKLCEIGLQINLLSFASKMEADYFEDRWMSANVSYFLVKRKKIHYFCEPKVLLNALKNDLYLYDICYYNDCVAKYEHIEQFYLKDKNRQYRLAPNLTDRHIYTVDFDNDDAVELFSRNVASGLSVYIDCDQIDKSARNTVQLIVKISDLCSFFNLTNDIHNINKILKDNESHIAFLKEMIIFFQSLKFIDKKNNQYVTHNAKFVRGFLRNIDSYLHLWEDLISKNRLPARTLNQGMTEEFIGKIRSTCNDAKPTVEQFEKAFKQLFILSAIKPLGKHKEHVGHQFFFNRISRPIYCHSLETVLKYKHELKDVPHLTSNITPINEEIAIPDSDYQHIDRTERHTVMYVSGYLMKKCKEYHGNCETFKNYANGTSLNITLNNVSMYFRYSQQKQISFKTIPSNHFVAIVEKLENVFRICFNDNHTNCKIENELLNKMKILNFEIPPCHCFPWIYLFKLFIKLRIAYTLRLNNREIGRKQKCFVIPLLLSESIQNFDDAILMRI